MPSYRCILPLCEFQKTGLSLQLIFFDGEEAFKQWTDTDSLYGSRRLASELQQTRFQPGPENQCGASPGKKLTNELDRIELFVLLDLLGGKNPSFHNYFAETSEVRKRLTTGMIMEYIRESSRMADGH